MSAEMQAGSEPLEMLLRSELGKLERSIQDQAQQIAEDHKRPQPNLTDVADAYRRQVLGASEDSQSLGERVASSISGITLISAILAIVFGVLGYFAGNGAGSDASGLYDIAKIFAGAVVGSTGVGAAAVTGVRRRK